MTTSEAVKRVSDGSYLSASTQELHEMQQALVVMTGPNPTFHAMAREAGEAVREELRRRSVEPSDAPAPISAIAPAAINTDITKENVGTAAWNEQRLRKLIDDQIEESQLLDYKAAGALARDEKSKREITKDVSAMANAMGGTLIYGIAEYQDKPREHLPEKLDPVTGRAITREWLENIIAQIRPRIPDVTITPVRLSTGEDHVAYVIAIPQAGTAHQASDFRYYRRYNFESVPMLDYEIRDVMNRKQHPRIKLSARFVPWATADKEGRCGSFVLKIGNSGSVLARHVAAIIDAPSKCRDKDIIFEDCRLITENGITCQRLQFSNSNGSPLFPDSTFEPIFKFRRGLFIAEGGTNIEHFEVTVFADNLPKQTVIYNPNDILLLPDRK